jgi:hypothetical protein
MKTVIIVCLICFSVATLLLVIIIWNRNRKLLKNETALKHEVEKSRKIIKFLSKQGAQAIDPEFLASLGIPVLQQFNNHLADLYKKIFLLELLAEAPQTVHDIGQYIKLLNDLENSKEKEYLLNNFSITLYGYKSVSYLMYNSLVINPENNYDGQTVINFLLTNLSLIHTCSKIKEIALTLMLLATKRKSLTNDDVINNRILEVVRILENCKNN